MNAPDANLLLFAYDKGSPFHAAARVYLEESLSSSEAYGLPIRSIHAFVRIATSPIWQANRLAMEQALKIVDSWLQRPNVRVLYPGLNHWPILRDLVRETHSSAKLFSDAAIAAIAVEYGATLHSHDRDFARFPKLRWHDPLGVS